MYVADQGASSLMPKKKQRASTRSSRANSVVNVTAVTSDAADAPTPSTSTAEFDRIVDAVTDKSFDRLSQRISLLAPLTPPAASTSLACARGCRFQPVALSTPFQRHPCGAGSTELANAAISHLLSESPVHSGAINNSWFHRISAPLGAHVPVVVKAKIWGGRFFKMAHLLPSFREVASETTEGHRATRDKPPQTLKLHEFVSAFHTFVSIRCERFLNAAPGMLKHMESIQEMHKLFGPEA
ncbi:hypothetical protein CAPTEDRAFT_186455 [Capitella teleta]|uniref:Uncharacterized protein n=1 Tax=Capitella teleta TaxID=283909 RepID=R7UE27_CAPTE|nr:hypothetical protein CAPTEDRAFT_186455 [Capitella teleta]|eukprot:ELU02033.1 hypothetical protein CAPTEDRAFT_186455 [Capitella teleta]